MLKNSKNSINSMNTENLVINLNKPENISSQQAVIKVKRLFSAKKAGHAGTLDPIATGILIVCLNEATKITRFISDLDKEYIVRLKFGERTDTYDLTGKIVEKTDYFFINEADIHKVLNNFTGRIKQIPPMYSAIKIGGQPLYKLARLGMNIKRPERTIDIYKLDLLSFNLPYLDLKISCSKGTYIRTLCDDIGNVFGVGAHMVSLERTRIGMFRIEDSASIEELKSKKDACHSIDSAISHLHEIILDEDSYYKAQNGIPITVNNLPLLPFRPVPKVFGIREGGDGEFSDMNQYVRLKSPENILFGIGKVEHNYIKIERLLNRFSQESEITS